MRCLIPTFVLLICYGILLPISGSSPEESSNTNNTTKSTMQLGNFSISLAVKDINASKEFYEKLGFKMTGGDLKHKYVILQNDTSTIGLFQGMFEKNTITFNPGWDRDCNTLDKYQDVREIQLELKKLGLNPVVAADETTSGPAFFTLVDPDGNPVLIDQHVSKPTKK
jgi:catechol 2,3-dioxygenase-like lactoylglutathione lyase family enzyme